MSLHDLLTQAARVAAVTLLLAAPMCAANAHARTAAITPSLIPQPAVMDIRDGTVRIDQHTRLLARSHPEQRVAKQLNAFLEQAGRRPIPLQTSVRKGQSTVRLEIDATLPLPPEGYTLDSSADGVVVRASTDAGLFYGAVTLWQLLTQGDGDGVLLPYLHIRDTPRFGWRGYMLDSARTFQSVADIKQILDLLALHKLNVFHWHLTDDQGWRIEIKRYPKLTDVGGCRIPVGDDGINTATGATKQTCGWYSQAQIREIVAYAAARHITVVPEIDVPGHATAAIAAYPWLGSTDTPIAVTSERGIHANLFNVDERTFAFLDDVFAEVAALFPGLYVHVGGDEAIKTQWKASPHIQTQLHALGLPDEDALQGWFMRRLEAILASHGKRLIGWDEILQGGLPANATVMSWRGVEGGITAAREGHDVVMSPTSAVYFDYLQTDSPNEFPGRPTPRLLPMQTVYAFEPVPDALTPNEQHHILGLQANMWTTDNRSFAGVLHNTFPRLLAIAETGWTPRDKKDYATFLTRLPDWMQRYRALQVAPATTPFEVLIDATPAPTPGRVHIQLQNPLGYVIHYSTDGSTPSAASPRYETPLELSLPVDLRTGLFHNGTAVAASTHATITADSLRSRSSAQLQQCSASGPILRMEDDGPAQGPRARFNVNILQPCWLWQNAPLAAASTLAVRAGRLPYWINQSPEEDASRRYLPARSAHGELDVRLGSCDGPLLASAPLPAQPNADGFITLQATLTQRVTAPDTLCIRFTGNTRPTLWVLDRATLSSTPTGH